MTNVADAVLFPRVAAQCMQWITFTQTLEQAMTKKIRPVALIAASAMTMVIAGCNPFVDPWGGGDGGGGNGGGGNGGGGCGDTTWVDPGDTLGGGWHGGDPDDTLGGGWHGGDPNDSLGGGWGGDPGDSLGGGWGGDPDDSLGGGWGGDPDDSLGGGRGGHGGGPKDPPPHGRRG